MKGSTSVFAMRLKVARLAKGLTQEEVGTQAGIDEFSAKTRINQYENGVHTPHLKRQRKLPRFLMCQSLTFIVAMNMRQNYYVYFITCQLKTKRR